jgi:NAD(P)-dependent dehydrogenase (short-subunit alcohol dehydrogenase family)
MSTKANQTALVTGCSSGLGRATALRLQSSGWRVFASARNQADKDGLEGLGLEVVSLDLRDSDSVRHAAESVLERCNGRLTGLVNNAGFTQVGAVEDLSRAEIREQFETNVFGTIELTNALLPAFRRQGTGKVVFMSSVCGRFSIPYFGSYSASKFALEAFADALRRETRGSGIDIQLVEPGLFNTRGFESTMRRFSERADSGRSVHGATCARTLEALGRSVAAIPEARSDLVACVVRDFLEGRSNRARRVVPATSLVYELAHRFIPDGLQDVLVDWRGRKTRGRSLGGQ